MAARDFWGEVVVAEVKTPLAILREQASMLGPKTNHLVEARVETYVEGKRFYHRFNLIVPSIDDYTYELFAVNHGIDLYPVRIWGTSFDLANEEEFNHWLHQELTSPNTRKILGNLISQAQS